MCDNLNLDIQFKNNELLGIIIAGGQSSRMGKQKPTLKVHGQSKPNMLERTASLLQKCLSEVWVSCRTQQLDTNYHCIYDQIENLGPIGGLYSSLNDIKDSTWQGILVLSCDLPFMNEATIYRLIQTRKKALKDNPNLLMTAYKQAEKGYIESLVAIYEKPALALFDAALKADARQVHKIIPTTLRHEICYNHQDALAFFNINYPADLEKAKKLIKSYSNFSVH